MRDMEAAKAFFPIRQSRDRCHPRACHDGMVMTVTHARSGLELDEGVKHRTNQYLNNPDRAGPSRDQGDRYGPMRGFKNHESGIAASVDVSTSSAVVISILIHAVAETFQPTPLAIVT